MFFLGIACAILGFVLFVVVGPILKNRHQSYSIQLAASNDRADHIFYYLVRGLGLLLTFSGGSILSHVFTLTTPVLILLSVLLIAILAVLLIVYR